MGSLATHWPAIAAMVVLIVASGMLSGSEAAFFSLTPRGRGRLAKSGYGGGVAERLLADPGRLLSAILFWNLLVNMTYFALATIVATAAGGTTAIVISVASLVAIVFLSEMLPKSLAMQSPVRSSVWLAPPISWAVAVVSPILPAITAANEVLTRLIWPTLQVEPEIELDDIQRAIELGTGDAAMLQRERGAMQGLLALSDVRVAEWMRPRYRCRVVQGEISRDVLIEPPAADDNQGDAGYVLLQDADEDRITHSILPRQLRPSQLDTPERALVPVVYVPWSARVSQSLDVLHAQDRDVAIVLDEFGSWLGAITIEDILRRVLLVDSFKPLDRTEPVDGDSATPSTTAGTTLLVSGDESLRSIVKTLGVTVDIEGVSTIGGYIQRYNERFPRVGDAAMLGEYHCEVTAEDDDETIIAITPTDPDLPLIMP